MKRAGATPRVAVGLRDDGGVVTAADRIAAIRAREQAATPGPWLVHEMGHIYVGNGEPGNLRQIVHVSGDDMGDLTEWAQEKDRADAAFIAHARDDVPRMADALAAVLALCDEAGPARGFDAYLSVGALSPQEVRAAITDALGGAE